MDTNEAKQVIEQDKRERAAECARRLDDLVKEMNCKIDAIVIIQNGQIQTQIQVTAL